MMKSDDYLSNKKIYELISTNGYRGYEGRIREAFEHRFCRLLNYFNEDTICNEAISLKVQRFINENLSFHESKSYFFGFSKELLSHCLKVYYNPKEEISPSGIRTYREIENDVRLIDMEGIHQVYCDEYFYMFKNVLHVLKECPVFYAYPSYKAEDFSYERNFLYILFDLLETKLNVTQFIQIYFDTYKDTNNYFELLKRVETENYPWVYKYILLFLNVQICCINIILYLHLRLDVLAKSNVKYFFNIFLTFSSFKQIHNQSNYDIITYTLQQRDYSVLFLVSSVCNIISISDIEKYIKCPSSVNIFKLFFLFKNKNKLTFEDNVIMLSQGLHYIDDITKNFFLFNDNFVYKRIVLDVLNAALAGESEDSTGGSGGEESGAESGVGSGGKSGGEQKLAENGTGSTGRTGRTGRAGVSDIDLDFSLIKNMKKHIEKKAFFLKTVDGDTFLKVCISLFRKEDFLLFTEDIKKNFKNIKTCIGYLEDDNLQRDVYTLKYFFYEYDYHRTEIVTNQREGRKAISPFTSIESRNILLEASSLFFSLDYLKRYSYCSGQEGSSENRGVHKSRSGKVRKGEEICVAGEVFIKSDILHPTILFNVNKLLLEFFYEKICHSSVSTLITFNHNLLSIYRVLRALIGTSANLMNFGQLCERVEMLSKISEYGEDNVVTILEDTLYNKIMNFLKKKGLNKYTIYITYIEYFYILMDVYCQYLYNSYEKNKKRFFFKGDDSPFSLFKNVISFFCKMLKINKCFHLLIEIKLHSYFKLDYEIKNSFVSLFTHLLFFSLKYEELSHLKYSIVNCLLFLLKKINIHNLNAYIFQMFSYQDQEELARKEKRSNRRIIQRDRCVFNSSDGDSRDGDNNTTNVLFGSFFQDDDPFGRDADDDFINTNINCNNLTNFQFEKDQMDIKENFRIDISFLKIFSHLDDVRKIHVEDGKGEDNFKGEDSERESEKRGYSKRESDKGGYSKRESDKGGYSKRESDKGEESREGNFSAGNMPRIAVERIGLEDVFVITLMHLCEVDNHRITFLKNLMKVYEEEKKQNIYAFTEIFLKLLKKVIQRRITAYFHYNVYRSFQMKAQHMLESINMYIKKWVEWTFKNGDNAFLREKVIDIRKIIKLFFLTFYRYVKTYFLQIYNFVDNLKIYNSNIHFDTFFFSLFNDYVNKVFILNFSAPFVFKLSKLSIINICMSIINCMVYISSNVNLHKVGEIHTIFATSSNQNVEGSLVTDVVHGIEHNATMVTTGSGMVVPASIFTTTPFNNFMSNMIVSHRTLLNKQDAYVKKKVNVFHIEKSNYSYLRNDYTIEYLTDILLLEKETSAGDIARDTVRGGEEVGRYIRSAGDKQPELTENVEKLLHQSTLNFRMNDLSTNGNSDSHIHEISQKNNRIQYNLVFSKFYHFIKNLLKVIFQGNYVFLLSDFLLVHYEQSEKKEKFFKNNLNMSECYYSIFNMFINDYNMSYYKGKCVTLSYSKGKSYKKLIDQIINRILIMYSRLLKIFCQTSLLKEINAISRNIASQIFSLFDTSHPILSLFPKTSLSTLPQSDTLSKAINSDVLNQERKLSSEKREVLTMSLLQFLANDYKNVYGLYESLNRYFRVSRLNNIYFLCKYSKGYLALSTILKIFTGKIMFYFKERKSACVNIKAEYTKRVFHLLKLLYFFLRDNDLTHISIYEHLFEVLQYIVGDFTEDGNSNNRNNPRKPIELDQAKILNLALHFCNAIYFNIFNQTDEQSRKTEQVEKSRREGETFWSYVQHLFAMFVRKLREYNRTQFMHIRSDKAYGKKSKCELQNCLYNLNIVSELFELVIKGVYVKDKCAYRLVAEISHDKYLCNAFFKINYGNVSSLVNAYTNMYKRKEDNANNLKSLLLNNKNVIIEKHGPLNDDAIIENILEVIREKKINYRYILNVSEIGGGNCNIGKGNNKQRCENIFEEKKNTIWVKNVLQNKMELLDGEYVSEKFFEKTTKRYGEKDFLFDLKNYYYCMNVCDNGGFNENFYTSVAHAENGTLFTGGAVAPVLKSIAERASDAKLKNKIDSSILKNVKTIFPEKECNGENSNVVRGDSTVQGNRSVQGEHAWLGEQAKIGKEIRNVEHLERKKRKKKEKKMYHGIDSCKDSSPSNVFIFSQQFKNEIVCMKYVNLTQSLYDSKMRLLLLLYKLIVISKHNNLFEDKQYQAEERAHLQMHNIKRSAPFLFFIHDLMIAFLVPSAQINRNAFYYILVTNILINLLSIVKVSPLEGERHGEKNRKVFTKETVPQKGVNGMGDAERENHEGNYYYELFIDESYIANIRERKDAEVFRVLNSMSKEEKERKHGSGSLYNMPIFLSLFLRSVVLHLHNFKFYNKNLYFLKYFNSLYVPYPILKLIYPHNHFNVSLLVNLLELFYVSIRIYNDHFVYLNRGIILPEKVREVKNTQSEKEEVPRIPCTVGGTSTYVTSTLVEREKEKWMHFDLYVRTMKEVLKECYETHDMHMKNEEHIRRTYIVEHMLLNFLYNRINTVYELMYYFFFKCIQEEKKNIFDVTNECIYHHLGNILHDHIDHISNFLGNYQFYYFYINTLIYITLNRHVCIHIMKNDILTKIFYVPAIYHLIFDKNKQFSTIYNLVGNQYIRNKNHIVFCSLIVFIIKMLYIFMKNVNLGNYDSKRFTQWKYHPAFESTNEIKQSFEVDSTYKKKNSQEYTSSVPLSTGRTSLEQFSSRKENFLKKRENVMETQEEGKAAVAAEEAEEAEEAEKAAAAEKKNVETTSDMEIFLDSILSIIGKLSDRINFIFFKIEKINCLAILEEAYLYVELLTKTSYYCDVVDINNFLISIMNKGTEHHLFYINRILEKFIYEKEVIVDPYSPYELNSSLNISNGKEKKKGKKNDLSLFTQRVLYICYKSILNYNTILLNIIQNPYFSHSYFVVHLYILILKSTRLVTTITEHFGRRNTTLIRTVRVGPNVSYVPICLDIVNTEKEKKKEKIYYAKGVSRGSFTCYLSDSNSASDISHNSGQITQYNRCIDEYMNTKRIYRNDYLFNFLPEMIELKSYYNILKEILERSAFLGAFLLDKLKNSCEDSCLKQILISNVCSYLIHINATLLPSNICPQYLKKKCTLIYNYVVNVHKK
ncbi:conserved Plasmodium protein, unknown function [Plasmodium ovale]|uniref:Uncharacterized protein n=1 Tax=Plasmodium ovale TaxID=36330 RepID=A0A1C3KNQ4_PLAOA|nr:conserved Plasmodium protein, unknown function [Plasmodium ovale]